MDNITCASLRPFAEKTRDAEYQAWRARHAAKLADATAHGVDWTEAAFSAAWDIATNQEQNRAYSEKQLLIDAMQRSLT